MARRSVAPPALGRPRHDRPLTTILGWSLPPWVLDVGPVALIAVIGMASIATNRLHPGASRFELAVGIAIAASLLLIRHRFPLSVMAVLVVLSLAIGWGPVVVLPLLLGVFTVAEYSERRRVIVAAVIAGAGLVATPALHHQQLNSPSVVSRLVVIGLAVAVGLYVRARADYISGLRERAERLEREQELLAQQAVAEERVRIARELHDVVAHNVSLMVVQAQALAATSNGDGGALGQVADLGRDALSEMHRMLGVLRLDSGDGAERQPQPGVRDLEALLHRTRATGLDARLLVEGETRDLAAVVDHSVYRIVQEALTNVVRHAHAEHAIVTLAYAADALELTVLDDGVGAADPPDEPRGGRGLVGMRERVALFGGELETGPRQFGQGYRVRALLPTS